MEEITEDRGMVTAAGSKPRSVDVSEHRYQGFLADQSVAITARAEELYPADPGELSGAELSVFGLKEDTTVSANFGHHSLGILSGIPMLRFFCEVLAVAEQGPKQNGLAVARLMEMRGDTAFLSGIQLVLSPTPELTVKILGGQHCFGVVRAGALRKLAEVGLMRAIAGKAAAPGYAARAAGIIHACLAGEPQNLGEFQRV